MENEIRELLNEALTVLPPAAQRATINAFHHPLTGNRMILQTHEQEAYQRLTTELTSDLTPKTELERQLVQKMIDCHTRLNRIAALDGNILNFGLTQNETTANHDDALETIAAQCRAWIQHADSFEKLGRYEARISRQLLQYTKELERLQANRRSDEVAEPVAKTQTEASAPIQTTENTPNNDELASYCKFAKTSLSPEDNPVPPPNRVNLLEYHSQ